MRGFYNGLDSVGLSRFRKGILLDEQLSLPTTPSSGQMTVYAKADGLLYTLNDAGDEVTYSPSDHTHSEYAAASHTHPWVEDQGHVVSTIASGNWSTSGTPVVATWRRNGWVLVRGQLAAATTLAADNTELVATTVAGHRPPWQFPIIGYGGTSGTTAGLRYAVYMSWNQNGQIVIASNGIGSTAGTMSSGHILRFSAMCPVDPANP
ncbi:hypothetical protein [Streptosporangium subroseum]|uniref:hypothetical protein n=1 Tax=Streptosporangium subroseum TaxID=106412 RepID=UPI0030923D7A|nr:hypothetical protein OHB15_14070 [Streptosporangium subroseum]